MGCLSSRTEGDLFLKQISDKLSETIIRIEHEN